MDVVIFVFCLFYKFLHIHCFEKHNSLREKVLSSMGCHSRAVLSRDAETILPSDVTEAATCFTSAEWPSKTALILKLSIFNLFLMFRLKKKTYINRAEGIKMKITVKPSRQEASNMNKNKIS